MANPLNDFLSSSTLKATRQLTEAFALLPADKRDWSPGGTARTALDQLAECVATNNYVATQLMNRVAPAFDTYEADKATAFAAGDKLPALLLASAERLAEAIQNVPDTDWQIVLETPDGGMVLADVAGLPYWNMSYHEGQVNYILAILGLQE
ncbi:MAG: DinB family protein [Armatimonadetes bacterium]|nr:DinB family protein [Armatimonadota bacterium]